MDIKNAEDNNNSGNETIKEIPADGSGKKLSARREKHLARQRKKVENIRTYEERKKFVDDILTKLGETTIPHDVKGIVMFRDILKKYLESGDTAQGIIPLNGFKYEIHYSLHRSKKFDCGAMLKANNNI